MIANGLALLAMVAASSAQALGLGEIEVKSRLNQPLKASIPVTSASVPDLESLSVQLASNDEFDRAGLERPDFLTTLTFEMRGDSIQIAGREAAREPFVTFLIEARWTGGRLLREYTILLDPPNLPTPAKPLPVAEPVPEPVAEALMQPDPAVFTPAVPAEPEPQPTPTPAPAAAEPAKPAVLPPPVPAAVEPPKPAANPVTAPAAAAANSVSSYGPVKSHETLWSIAFKLRPDARAITMDQMQVALFEANRSAFNGTLTGLRTGAMLKVPTVDEIRAVDAATARSQVRSAKAAPTPNAVVESPPTPTPTPAVEPPPKVEPPAPATLVAEPAAVAPVATVEAATPAAAEPATAAAAPEAMYDEDTTAPSAPALVAEGETPVSTTPVEVAPAIVETPAAPTEEPAAFGVPPPLLFGAVGILVLGMAWVWMRKRRATAPAVTASIKPPKMVTPAAVAAAVAADEAPTMLAPPTKRVDPEVTVAVAPVVPVAEKLKALSATQQTVAFAESKPAAVPAAAPAKPGFDANTQFANTVQINLDANDPLAEADFHLAYGLYDEAALLLQQASQKAPDRIELRAKLVEVYFAANRAEDFRKIAEGLKGKVADTQWQKIAIMGQQLCPDADAFKGGGDIGADVDLAFDEVPATNAIPEPVLELPKIEPAVVENAALEFNLEDLQIPGTEPPAPAADAGNTVQFDLADIQLESPAPASEPISGDETATKLDLARAYLDMGDNDMAKGLLNEVLEQGNAQQQDEARSLQQRLT